MRPLAIFGGLAAVMVSWLSCRMWFGRTLAVWELSCVLGAWAPLFAAGLFLYIRAVNDRENNAAAAWCVRALGMHCVLVWLLGVSDWLRGPPGTLARWNTDVGMPVVFVAFVPVFGLSLALLAWVDSALARVAPARGAKHAEALAQPTQGLPYRAQREPAEAVSTPVARPPWWGVVAALTSGAAVWALMAPSASTPALVLALTVALALCAHLGRGAMLTSVAVIAATALSLGLRGRALGGPPIDTTGALMGSSLVAVASLVSWLLLLELTLMGRRGLARARRTSAAR
ncbi:MAG: hypothetical protein JNK72_04285 [Myxococcales bacterium]|nr:hypothetical protein [Myxococcales bacterium]